MKDARFYDTRKEEKEKLYSFEGLKNKQRKVFFVLEKRNEVKVKRIWSTEKTQGAVVESKTFENVWRSFSNDEVQ
jgi:hypothetical protein